MSKPDDDEASGTALMGLVALVFVCAYLAHLVFLAWDWIRGRHE